MRLAIGVAPAEWRTAISAHLPVPGSADVPVRRHAQPPRHRARRTKCREQFHSASAPVPTSTGAAAITIYPAGQITYADGHTEPVSAPATRPAAGDTS